ncbi:hypothetical protein F5146DRAFT_1072640 [Armillaria mellea]|nr:hypothetical protein F5146DRAFT_1072640 [Armillaria mellea]
MPALEHLEMVGDTRALDCISAPRFQSFKITGEPFANVNHDPRASPVLDFLRYSERSIHGMEVNRVGTYDNLVAILSQTPSLESLTCNVSFNRAFLTKMKSPSSLLPQLHTLTLRFHDLIRFPHVKFILDVVESRLEGGFLKRVSIHLVGRTSIKMFDERLAPINATSDVTVFLEDSDLFSAVAGEDYDGDIYMQQVYNGFVTEDDLP